MSDLQTYCREMVEVIYPEAAPYLFVLTADEWRNELTSPLKGDFVGECRKLIGPSERRFIEARGEWRGAHPLIVIISDYAWSTPEVGATVIHELAHATKPSFFPQTAEVPNDEASAASHRTWLQDNFAESETFERPRWGYDHGDRHIRACLHLAHRAGLVCYPIDQDAMCADERYGLSPAAAYAAALGDEPERLIELSLHTIGSLPAPAAFTELFERDTQA